MVRWSALHTGRFYVPENIPDNHFYQSLCRNQGHSATERMTPSGITPAAFRRVAQFLSYLRHSVHQTSQGKCL
jgi:hypothetical protein